MKLLLDQNLPRRFATELLDLFPEIRHVTGLGLTTATDEELWIYAREHGFAIVSKDADFHHLSFRYGAPPKIIWIRLGNCKTHKLMQCLIDEADTIREFANDPIAALLVLPHSGASGRD